MLLIQLHLRSYSKTLISKDKSPDTVTTSCSFVPANMLTVTNFFIVIVLLHAISCRVTKKEKPKLYLLI